MKPVKCLSVQCQGKAYSGNTRDIAWCVNRPYAPIKPLDPPSRSMKRTGMDRGPGRQIFSPQHIFFIRKCHAHKFPHFEKKLYCDKICVQHNIFEKQMCCGEFCATHFLLKRKCVAHHLNYSGMQLCPTICFDRIHCKDVMMLSSIFISL